VPFVDSEAAEKIFRHEVMLFLKDEGLLSEERTELLLSWRRSGFSVPSNVTVCAADQGGLERLARYLMRRRSASGVSTSTTTRNPRHTASRGRHASIDAGSGGGDLESVGQGVPCVGVGGLYIVAV
jgi:hypothetical protein